MTIAAFITGAIRTEAIRTIALTTLAIALGTALPGTARAQAASGQREQMNRPAEPFKLIGNVYYVGTDGLASFLISSPQGHVLVNAGTADTVPLIEASITKLGFQLADVKYLVVTRAHADQAGGLTQLQKDTGAQILAGAADKAALESGLGEGVPPIKVDVAVNDGDKLNLIDKKVVKGGVLFVAHAMPGPTPGCTSWTLPVREQKWNHTVMFFCAPFTGVELGGSARAGIAGDYQKTLSAARGIIADVFVGPYPDMFKLNDKRALIHDGWLNPFIKAGEYHAYLMAAEKDFKAALARQPGAVSADAAPAPPPKKK